jgi:hypothetical protein
MQVTNGKPVCNQTSAVACLHLTLISITSSNLPATDRFKYQFISYNFGISKYAAIMKSGISDSVFSVH